MDVLAWKAKRKCLVSLISGEFADRAETLVGVNLTFISESQFCYALGLWFYIMFIWTSSVFLLPPRGWLALLLTTVCPAPPLFSKDLKVFHHRPRHCFHSDSPALSRQAGRLSRGGKFVSSGNTVFSLSLTPGDKQGCWNWCRTRCYFFDVFFCLCFARSLVLNCSFGQTELLTCTQSGDSLHVFFFGNWTYQLLRAAQSHTLVLDKRLPEQLLLMTDVQNKR